MDLGGGNNGFAEFARRFNDFGNQLGTNIRRVFNDGQGPRRGGSSDDVLGLDAEAFREATIAGNDGGELATYVNEKLVCEAGVDFDGRPMLVFAACRLLNPDVVDYDRLLNLIQFRLDDFVESDYTLVLFAANARYKPNVRWLYEAYRRLGRKYKKNLKALYIVHPAKWVQIVMTAMNAVLSPKFARKVKWVDTLSELAQVAPINQINIPPEVYQYNATKEPRVVVPTPARPASRLFGVPLEQLMGMRGELGLPAPVADALDYLYTHALEVPDLFRRAPPPATLQQVRSRYEAGRHASVAYATWGEHVAAAVLKSFCRELPQPVVPPQYYELVRQIPDPQAQPTQAGIYVRDVVLPALADPPCVSLLLAALFGLLRAVADHAAANNMTPARLAAAWAPNFVRSSQPDVDISMCAVARFEPPPPTRRQRSRPSDSNDDAFVGEDEEDDDVLDFADRDALNRPNIVTLARLMIDHYQLIFKPTLEAVEALTKQQPAGPGALPAVASDEDVEALVAEMDAARLSGPQAAASKPITAEDISRRLQEEQDAATHGDRPARSGELSDDEIIVAA